MLRIIGHVESLFLEIVNARREPEAERVTQREDLIGEAVGVAVVLGDPKLELVIKQPVQHVRRIARGGDDRRLATGNVCLERDAGACAISQIDLSDVFSDAADGIELAVDDKVLPAPPVGGKGQAALIVHRFGQRFGTGFVPHVPGARCRAYLNLSRASRFCK